MRSSGAQFWFASLDGDRGRWIRGPAGDEILLAPSLTRQERREVLAHELVHAERGIGWPVATPATMELEEERVWRIALGRLAPSEEVEAFLRRRGTVGPVTVADVAEEFDLSPDGAARLARLLAVQVGRLPP
ncbi:MAG: IrrE N-terminal-like domain [Acidimicrobiales bacterium]|nr:IrrE N-terminal-like domain [Acidimicrobiales bacterium]